MLSRVLENALRPPTDNLYKFAALAGVVVATLLYGLIVREMFRLRQEETDVIVGLVAAGVPADVMPADAPADASRSLLVRRQLLRQEAAELQELALNSPMKHVIGGCLAISTISFGFWLVRVQWPQDMLLRHQVDAVAPRSDQRRADAVRLLLRWWRRRNRARSMPSTEKVAAA